MGGAPEEARRVELADIVRAHGPAYRQAHRLTRGQHRALRAIAACRTAALGGHTEACDRCGAIRIAYNSCRNRHCPKCQTLAKERWLAARRADLLPVELCALRRYVLFNAGTQSWRPSPWLLDHITDDYSDLRKAITPASSRQCFGRFLLPVTSQRARALAFISKSVSA